jgi:hypothetical protein
MCRFLKATSERKQQQIKAASKSPAQTAYSSNLGVKWFYSFYEILWFSSKAVNIVGGSEFGFGVWR